MSCTLLLLMPYLDTYSTPLTAATAAHLLRRATAGPRKPEISAFTSLTSTEAYDTLLANVQYYPEPVIHLDTGNAGFGNALNSGAPFDTDSNFGKVQSVRFWWLGLMANQSRPPSLLEKLALFWQNHFVVSSEVVTEYRFVWRYLNLIRDNALGNFRSFVKQVTIDPAMLEYLNGNQNVNGAPNENYARELQELFTVGEKDFYGNANYTEQDVKEAARVLTGWRHYNYWWNGTTSIYSAFQLNRHDTGNKIFSAKYNNAVITGNNTTNAGNVEVDALISMLLNHPETPKFICRKLYRWYVNPNVTEEIENNVIIPLANFFKSPGNNYQIEPVLRKLLTSDIFFDISNRGAILKSPIELIIGAYRLFNLPPPNAATEPGPAEKYLGNVWWNTLSMQMPITAQSSVFGYEPYYLASRSKGWLSSATLALRYQFADTLIWPWLQVTPSYKLGLDLVGWATSLQPNFGNVAASAAITTEQILASFAEHLFVFPLSTAQQNFLIDTIMMQGIPRSSWIFEWNRYRQTPANLDNFNTVRWRLSLLMRYMLRMAEFQIS
ncbi:MAG: DUF1800 domain-containing protein [Bacteroidetes bacterium]|uniref:DUF1800 domain-containing protein n=1 Tax=Phnomibacter sp. TaxID=2836217 RepID=UPI002FDE4978|nr:DUF1800 domain-containing protein [Bacteroidota bacterium]